MEQVRGLSVALFRLAQAGSDIVGLFAGHLPAAQEQAGGCIFNPQEHRCARFDGAVEQPSRLALAAEVLPDRGRGLLVEMTKVEQELPL